MKNRFGRSVFVVGLACALGACNEDHLNIGVVDGADLAAPPDMVKLPDLTERTMLTVFRDPSSPDSQAVPQGASRFGVMRYGMRVTGSVDARIIGYEFGLRGLNKETGIEELRRTVSAMVTCANLVFMSNTVRCNLPAPRVILAGKTGYADLDASFARMSAGTYIFAVTDVILDPGGTVIGLPVESNQITVVDFCLGRWTPPAVMCSPGSKDGDPCDDMNPYTRESVCIQGACGTQMPYPPYSFVCRDDRDCCGDTFPEPFCPDGKTVRVLTGACGADHLCQTRLDPCPQGTTCHVPQGSCK